MKKTLIILAATFVAGAATAQTQPVQSEKAIDAQQSIKTEKATVSNAVSAQSSSTVDLRPATEAVKSKARSVKGKTKQAVSSTTERVGNTADAGIGKVKKIGSSAANSSAEVNGSAAVSTQVGNRINSNTRVDANKKVSASGIVDNTQARTARLQGSSSGMVNGNAASVRSNASKSVAAPGVNTKTKLNSANTLQTRAVKARPTPIKAAAGGGIRSSLGL